MQLVDSHCHLDQLDLTAYDGELKKALAYAEKQGVCHMLCVCITLEHFPAMLRIAQTYPNISVSVGLHPNERNILHEPSASELIALAQDEKVVAIGETGLDYFRSEGELDWQRDRFRQHIRAAKKLQKPLIIHTRDAMDDTFAIMKEEHADNGVMHCFTGNWAAAKVAVDMGFYISISGIVTFKNALDIQEVAKNMPLDRLLIETDSPYLAPVPYRGKPNEPAYVRHVAECIAGLRGISLELLAERTTANFFTLFKGAQRHV
jgi:TatD DNase family protein